MRQHRREILGPKTLSRRPHQERHSLPPLLLPIMSNLRAMRKVSCLCLLFAASSLFSGCAAKHPVTVAPPPPPAAPPPPPAVARPVRSQMPPSSAEIIEHCVITRQENANTVSCACVPITTKIDSKTGHTEIVCKKTKEER
jgi:hypothetical protein